MARKPPPRLKTFDYIGLHRYFLTIATFKRSRIFIDDDAARAVTTQLAHIAAAEGYLVVAYCLMPDHLHALLEAEHEAVDFKKFVRASNGY